MMQPSIPWTGSCFDGLSPVFKPSAILTGPECEIRIGFQFNRGMHRPIRVVTRLAADGHQIALSNA